MTLVYDPSGLLASNSITNEIHSPITEPDIWPSQLVTNSSDGSSASTPFYKLGLSVTGIAVGSTSGPTALVEFTDYVMSPLFATRSADTGKEVYSYILLINYTNWTSITLNYQAVGGDPDTVLINQIVAAGTFDKTNLETWQTFTGELATLGQVGSNYSLTNTDTVNILSGNLNSIALALQAPNGYKQTLDTNISTLNSEVTGLQSTVNSLQADINNLTQGVGLTSLQIAPTIASVGDIKLISEIDSGSLSTISSNWIPCDGSAVSQTTYSLLYNKIGNTYYTTAGTGQFNVPNLANTVSGTVSMPHYICYQPYYVNYMQMVTSNIYIFVSPLGSDSNTGTTPTSPVASFAKAIELIQYYYPVTTPATSVSIYISLLEGTSTPNTYTNCDILSAPSQTNIIIQGYNSATASGSNYTFTAPNNVNNVILNGSSNISINAVTYQNIYLQDNATLNNPTAIRARQGGQVTIGNNVTFGQMGPTINMVNLVAGNSYIITSLGSGYTTAQWLTCTGTSASPYIGQYFTVPSNSVMSGVTFSTGGSTATFIPNGAHIAALQDGNVAYNGTGIIIAGHAGQHLRSLQSGNITIETPTITIKPSFNFICHAFAYADTNANIIALGGTINVGGSNGTVTGYNYIANTSAIITVPGNSPTFFPGTRGTPNTPNATSALGAIAQATSTIMGIAKTATASILSALTGTTDLTDNTSIVTPVALTWGIRFGYITGSETHTNPWVYDNSATVSVNSLVVNNYYTINSVGTTTLAQWQSVGYPNTATTVAVGDMFQATATHPTGATGTTGNAWKVTTSFNYGNWYLQLPSWLGGFLIQGGSMLLPTGMGDTITFPIPFTTAIYTLIPSDQGPGSRITGMTFGFNSSNVWPGCNPGNSAGMIVPQYYPINNYTAQPTLTNLQQFAAYAFIPSLTVLGSNNTSLTLGNLVPGNSYTISNIGNNTTAQWQAVSANGKFVTPAANNGTVGTVSTTPTNGSVFVAGNAGATYLTGSTLSTGTVTSNTDWGGGYCQVYEATNYGWIAIGK